MEHFRFALTPLSPNACRSEVARALEQYTEYKSRAANPQLWGLIDRLNARHADRPPRRTSWFRRILSFVCLVLGLLLMVPGLMEPSAMPWPLAMGCLAVLLSTVALWIEWRRGLGWLLLPIGCFLTVAGFAAPSEMAAPLVVGLAALGLSAAALITAGRKKKDRFRKPAEQLLAHWSTFPEGKICVVFTEDCVTFVPSPDASATDACTMADSAPDTPAVENLSYAYRDLLCVVETTSLFFLAFRPEDGLLLHKAQLQNGTPEDLRTFLQEKTDHYTMLCP